MGIKFSRGTFFLELQISFLFFFNHHHHTTANASTPTLTQPTYQHIPTHTNTYYHNQTPPNTTPISSTDTGPLHSKWHEACTGNTRTVISCMMRTCQTDKEWATALALWTSGQVRAVRTQRADWTSDHCQRAVKRERRERKRETREEERGRHERKRDARREERDAPVCTLQNVLVCTFKTPVSFVTRAFLKVHTGTF